ncbi:MAG TPA: VOC family protein [Nitrobacter sp.]|nr:VOC family protein [Nitrobacter sp.]
MPDGLDHIVHAVRDLDAAAAFYERAGFMVGVRNRHPFGTHNRIVQLDGFYFELLTVAEPDKIPPAAEDVFSFGSYHRAFLSERQGLSMLLQKSRDATADARAFDATGIGGYKTFDFAREGVRPDGSPVKLAFSLAFAQDRTSPHVRFAVCQHHYPENFWNPAFQIHANGAQHVLGAVMVASRPSEHERFLAALTGARSASTETGGIMVAMSNSTLEAIEPAAFRGRYGVEPALMGEGMFLNGLRMAVTDLDRTEAVLRRNGIVFARRGEHLVIPPNVAFGATLAFEQPKVS